MCELEVDPENVGSYLGLVEAYQRLGNRTQALLELREAYAQLPGNIVIVGAFADALMEMNRRSEAKRILLQALEEGLDDPALRERLSELE